MTLQYPRRDTADVTEAERAPFPLPAEAGTAQTSRRWQQIYARRLVVVDFFVVALMVFGTQIFWLGTQPTQVSGAGYVDYTTVSFTLVVAWMATLSLYGTRSPRVIGYGSAEYRTIIDGALRLFGIIAIISYIAQVDVSRGYILLSLPLGVLGLIIVRWLTRRWLARQRKRGRMVSRVLLVGEEDASLRILAELARQPEAGFVVVAACSPSGRTTGAFGESNVPVLGDLSRLSEALRASEADTVIVSGEAGLPAHRVRELSWELEAGRQHLIVAPNLTDIGGPRIHTRPVAGLPLMHVETPQYSARQVYSKRAFDVVVSAALLIVLSPAFLILSAMVTLSSPGPVFYGQERESGSREFRSGC